MFTFLIELMPGNPKRKTTSEVWVNPKSNLKGARGDRAFDDRFRDVSASRILELADIALGLKKPPQKKKRHAVGAGVGNNGKTEPYST